MTGDEVAAGLERIIRLAWQAGQARRDADGVVDELLDLHAREHGGKPTPTSRVVKLRRARREFPRYRDAKVSAVARLLRIDRKTVREWKS